MVTIHSFLEQDLQNPRTLSLNKVSPTNIGNNFRKRNHNTLAFNSHNALVRIVKKGFVGRQHQQTVILTLQ